MREPAYNKNNHDDTVSRRTKSLLTKRIQSRSRANIALQLTGTALHLSPVKSLARLHRRSKAAAASSRVLGDGLDVDVLYDIECSGIITTSR